MSKAEEGKIGLWAVVAIGVGGMVDGGIFAVLGLAVQMAHGGTPVAFAVAGVVALLTTYSYAKLSVAYPSRGGAVTFLNRTLGAGMPPAVSTCIAKPHHAGGGNREPGLPA